MSAPVTASKLGLLACCQAPWAPGAVWHDYHSPAANLGTLVHAAIAAFLRTGALPPDESPAATLFAAWFAWWSALFAFGTVEVVEVELRYALDIDTRVVSRVADGFRAVGSITGTPDLVARIDGMLTVFDWKTGQQKHLDPIEVNGQLLFYGCCVSRLFGEPVRIAIAHIQDDGLIWYRCSDVAMEEVDDLISAWVALIDEAPIAQPTPGPHCSQKYCPVVNCEALGSAVAAVPAIARADGRVRLPIVGDVTQIESAEQAVDQYEQLQILKLAIAQGWEALHAWLQRNGASMELRDGRVYGQRTTRRTAITLNTATAAELEALAGKAAVEVSTSQAAIKRALVAQGRPAKDLDGIMAALTDLGAVSVNESKTFDVWSKK